MPSATELPGHGARGGVGFQGLGKPRKLPQGWPWVKLGDHVAKIGSGLTPLGGQSAYTDKGIAFIRSQNVHMNRFAQAGLVYITETQDAVMRESRVFAGDILLNITGASIGRVCLVPDEVCPANVNQHVSIIRSDGSFAPAFLSLYLSTPGFQKFIMDSQAGATRQALTKAMIQGFEIPLPPLHEQKRIAGILTEQIAAVEQARKAAEDRLAAVNALPSAYLCAVFPASDQPLPKHWRRLKLGDHATKVGSGLTPLGGQSAYVESGIPLIRSQNVRMNRFDQEGLAYITVTQDARMRESRVFAGDVLLNITGASIGRVCLVPPGVCPANVNQHVSIIRSDGSFDPAFLSFYLSTPGFQEFIMDSQAGATRQALTKPMIEHFNIPLPPLPEQRHIAAVLNEQMAAVGRARKTAEEELATINALPAALLRRAFNGEL